MPSTTSRTFVSAFRSGVTDAISDAVGFPVAVIAATDDPDAYARSLTQTAHGAWVAAPLLDDAPFRREAIDPHDFTYVRMPFCRRWLRGGRLPPGLSLFDGMLAVRLPENATGEDLDAFLALALTDMRFDLVAQEPSDVRRRHASGHAIHVPPRYAGATEAVMPVRNLYRLRSADFQDVTTGVALALNGLMVRSGVIAELRGPDRGAAGLR